MNNFYNTISRDVNKAILENESQIFELKKEEIINQKLKEKDKEIERLNNIIDKAKEKSIYLQERYGYILDDLTFMLMQGSDKE